MTSNEAATTSPSDLLERWLRDFEGALNGLNSVDFSSLFVPDAFWRDLLAFTWDLHTYQGAGEVIARFDESMPHTQAGNFRISQSTPPRQAVILGAEVIEGLFTFETAVGHGRGAVRLIVDEEQPRPRAWMLLTTLRELSGFEESRAPSRAKGASALRKFGEPNWLDRRLESQEYKDHDPAVLVIGAGQNGLTLAARLNQLDVDTLVVDTMDRIGDNWRKRYRALVLHNETAANHLPYMPFPDVWPSYISKDQLASWFEAYAEALEINVWTGTEFLGATYEDDESLWTVRLQRADGTQRVMRPRHLVMAVGINGIPQIPNIPGLGDFEGTVLHSAQYKDGTEFAGKRALVIGTGNSAHDVAQDLYSRGATVSMVQRGSTTVVSIDPSAKAVGDLYREGLPLEDADLFAGLLPYDLAIQAMQRYTALTLEWDKELLAGLERVGFRTDIGEDDTGWVMKFRRRSGGYYLNVGCSDLLVERKVGLLQYAQVERITARGLLLKDGSTEEADLLVLATGHQSQQELVRHFFGDPVAERVGPIWDFDEEGEVRNLWKRTAQDGLWFMAGSLIHSRPYSIYLALQIKAVEEGIITKSKPVGSVDASLTVSVGA